MPGVFVCHRICLETNLVVSGQPQRVLHPLELERACLETSLPLHWALIHKQPILVSLISYRLGFEKLVWVFVYRIIFP